MKCHRKVLIPTQQDCSLRAASTYIQAYFPTAPAYDIRMILNCPVVPVNAGSILIRQGDVTESIYLILRGGARG
ncbi:hypothetical protein ACFL0Q_06270 [Thermodesulfobacteriota bacterium]